MFTHKHYLGLEKKDRDIWFHTRHNLVSWMKGIYDPHSSPNCTLLVTFSLSKLFCIVQMNWCEYASNRGTLKPWQRGCVRNWWPCVTHISREENTEQHSKHTKKSSDIFWVNTSWLLPSVEVCSLNPSLFSYSCWRSFLACFTTSWFCSFPGKSGSRKLKVSHFFSSLDNYLSLDLSITRPEIIFFRTRLLMFSYYNTKFKSFSEQP